MTSITDERGDELMYAGVRISEVVKKNSGIGGVLGLLWFQRELPEYFCKFLELCLIVTADHGPAVSGAHNTIVAARAGKDLVKFNRINLSHEKSFSERNILQTFWAQ